jgi:hypothetical protein
LAAGTSKHENMLTFKVILMLRFKRFREIRKGP